MDSNKYIAIMAGGIAKSAPKAEPDKIQIIAKEIISPWFNPKAHIKVITANTILNIHALGFPT